VNILICHNEYAAPSGEEHAISEIASLMCDNGHNVEYFFRSSATIKNKKDKFKAFFSGIRSPEAVISLKKQLASRRPDVAFVQNLYPFLSPSILPLLHNNGIPVIMRCPNYRLFCPNGLFLSHNVICERCAGGNEYWAVLRNCESDLPKSIGYAARNAVARMTKRIISNVDCFIVLSEFQRHKFIDNGIPENKVVILHNVLPKASHNVASHNLGAWVTFVGRISPEKGIEDFVDAARLLPDIPFNAVGNYETMAALVKKSPSNIKWRGFLKGKALDDVHKLSRILVMPSWCYEGFPNVITRGMLFALPVIASNIGGIPEIVENGVTGLLYEPKNVDDLVAKIQYLYNDVNKCMKMGIAGQVKAKQNYNREVIGQKLEEILWKNK
jgi:glycosyltransferase involved in cell wall biosynthesis